MVLIFIRKMIKKGAFFLLGFLTCLLFFFLTNIQRMYTPIIVDNYEDVQLIEKARNALIGDNDWEAVNYWCYQIEKDQDTTVVYFYPGGNDFQISLGGGVLYLETGTFSRHQVMIDKKGEIISVW